MRARGNDLERPAIALLPVIADIKAALAAQPGCRLAAMSGSGPTCFGIFADAAAAARLLRRSARHPAVVDRARRRFDGPCDLARLSSPG